MTDDLAPVTLACQAMATRFEIVLYGQNPVALRAAGEEALQEIERLEDQLSLYRSSSEIAHLNARAGREPVRVTPTLFALLQHAAQLQKESDGAFDITVAPLVKCWGFMGASGRLPDPQEVENARSKVGMHQVQLEPKDFTVRFANEGVMLDLGAIGKGYALDRAVSLLREAGVANALIHGGTSSVYGLGHPPDAQFWQVAVANPISGASNDGKAEALAVVPLKNEALSVSAVRGRSFQAQGKTFGHVLDPRTGQPTLGGQLAVVVLPSATETDALSTALLTLGSPGHQKISRLRPNMRTLLVLENEKGCRIESNGIPVQGSAS